MDLKKLEITMLGKFTVACDGIEIITEDNGKNKVISFLQYLLVNRRKTIPQQELIDAVLGKGTYSNPVNTIKNLAYRCRKLLDGAGVHGKDYIYCHKGSYGISPEAQCQIDTETFEDILNKAKKTKNKSHRLTYLIEAINIYNGDFLPASTHKAWVQDVAHYYQKGLSYAVKTSAALLSETGNYNKILKITENVLKLYPYNEEFCTIRLKALYKAGGFRNVIGDYETTEALLFGELGVTPSEDLQRIYLQSISNSETLFTSAEEAMNKLLAKGDGGKAYYCNYQIFSNLCCFLKQQSAKYSQCIYLILATITPNNTDNMEKCFFKRITENFHRAALMSLDDMDMYTRCNSNQFLILLPESSEKKAKNTARRLVKTYNEVTKNNNTYLHIQFTSYNSWKKTSK